MNNIYFSDTLFNKKYTDFPKTGKSLPESQQKAKVNSPNCNNKPNILIIIKSKNGNVFGGHIEQYAFSC